MMKGNVMGNELFSLGQRVMWLEPSFGIMVGRIIAVIDTPDGCFYNVVFDNKISSCVSVKILPLKGKDLLSLESRDMKEYKHNDGTAEKTKELLRALADVMDGVTALFTKHGPKTLARAHVLTA